MRRVNNCKITQVSPITDSAPKSKPSATKKPGAESPALTIIGRAEHGISRQQISPNSLKVLYALNDAGYQAFIVGGGVRDILIGLKPKDFDIATDATPEQIKAIFRNSRIIGRRFRIVHVHFGREIIEVSTFRAITGENVEIVENRLSRHDNHLDSVHSSSGMILRDNVYGTIEEDVLRRDFTANALYYTVRNFAVHDYVNGMADVDLRCLRMIGDPEQRYREDPVRILRAIRLAAKLGFTIEPATAAPLRPYAQLLTSIPSARLFDEFMKLFFSGYGEKTFLLLQHYGVFGILFPGTAAAMLEDSGHYQRMLHSAFKNTDARINAEKSVTPAFLLAIILWPALQKKQETLEKSGMPPAMAINDAAQAVLGHQLERISIPRRFSLPMREIWDMQLRLTQRRGKKAELLLSNKRFRAAYDFLLLREAAGEELDGLGQWWTDYQLANPELQAQMQTGLGASASSHAKPRRRRVKSRHPPGSKPASDI
ncbi:MAG: polynucleotide adenylyltransferase PcnB [Pseudomonadota bacterium]